MIVVSAYYKIPNKLSQTMHLGKKDVSIEEGYIFYMEHIKRLFKYIDSPIIFFTDFECYNDLLKIARNNVTFIIKSFEDMDIFKEYPESFWINHIKNDTAPYHTWQLGALWANKKYFVRNAIDICNNKEWFVWVDAGCIRTDEWESRLVNFSNRSVFIKEEGVYFQLLNTIPKGEYYFNDYNKRYIAGGIFIVHKNYINTLINEYNKWLNKYTERGYCAILDQFIMASLSLNYNWIFSIKPRFYVPDEWFFFLALL